MGATASKPEEGITSEKSVDKVDVSDTEIRLYQIGNTLARKLKEVKGDASVPSPDVKRQEVLDSSIQEKIHKELNKLRKQEQDVQEKIRLALEKENLDREGKSWFGKDKGQSSELLQQELDRVKAQIEKFNKHSLDSFPSLKQARQDVVQCYRNQETRTLDCWREVETFRKALADAEKDLFAAWK
ncbi:hypothetical protein MYAM1_002088 [Malassezia yamatoensis]|uniref:MICOS complex subunit mic19 n=1 Tax=Malassezia yamatoensis TaxID=253288 RepID=A0AAJ6CGZ4_9BASI|nr:hypothetical protein MYAM1_002088 [Malassezia yamatoensis]